LVSTEIAGSPAVWKAVTAALDVLELSAAVGVAGALARLGIGLQTEALRAVVTLCGAKDARSEEPKAGAAIHCALQHL
jgi:hypothetical protein